MLKRVSVKFADLIISRTANGIVRPIKETDVTSNVGGYITEIFSSEGEWVEKDKLIIKLDDSEQQIALNEAEDKLLESRVEYGFLSRNNPLDKGEIVKTDSISLKIDQLNLDYSKGFISEEEYFTKKNDYEIKLLFSGAKKKELILNKSGFNRAMNAKKRAVLGISYTNISAPFSGVIADFELVPGMRVSSGITLFKILDVSKLYIDVGILETDIAELNIGDNALVDILAIADKTYEGKVVRISPLY